FFFFGIHFCAPRVSVLYLSGDDGKAITRTAQEMFDSFPNSPQPMRAAYTTHATQARLQVTHQIATVSQVSMSLASAALRVTIPQDCNPSTEAASPSTSHAPYTGTARCPNSPASRWKACQPLQRAVNFLINVKLLVKSMSHSTPCIFPCTSLLSFASSHPSMKTELTTDIHTVSGVISLLNEYCISHRKPLLSFSTAGGTTAVHSSWSIGPGPVSPPTPMVQQISKFSSGP
ncbi:hypothetical protein EI94DRAFT_1870975, partial [Lactarius quietus]